MRAMCESHGTALQQWLRGFQRPNWTPNHSRIIDILSNTAGILGRACNKMVPVVTLASLDCKFKQGVAKQLMGLMESRVKNVVIQFYPQDVWGIEGFYSAGTAGMALDSKGWNHFGQLDAFANT